MQDSTTDRKMTKNIIRKIRNTLKREGALGLCAAAMRIVLPNRAASLKLCQALLEDRTGLEIGGPSGVFQRSGLLPIYGVVRTLDNCNFSNETEWEGTIQEGKTFRFNSTKEPGRQFVGEATNLHMIPSDKYDFVLSSHVLEHSANPIGALLEWLRVLKTGGSLIILVPHKDGTFDHLRPVTSLQHLKEDFSCQMPETDESHIHEILVMHDLSRDPEAGTAEDFKLRCSQNIVNRCIHQHVFDTRLVIELLDHVGAELLALEAIKPYHILAVARKCSVHMRADNRTFTDVIQDSLQRSPFPTDHLST